MKVAVIIGTRPELVKMAPVIPKLQKRDDMDLEFIHTGQHYDWELSQLFIEEFKLPQPSFFLNAKSGSHGQQTGRIMSKVERCLKRLKPDVVLVEGDTNSALGAALAASKMRIPVGHVEAGCRSFDMTMPEEINRMTIADCATFNFTPTKNATLNLLREGVFPGNIYLTGHPLIETLQEAIVFAERSDILKKYDLSEKKYVLITIHREENTDNVGRLKEILCAISKLNLKVIFPIHPRTKRQIKRHNLTSYTENFLIVSPIGYFDSLKLIKDSRYVITDSGGIQQEAALLSVPCITLRYNSEWMETVEAGLNFLAGAEHNLILKKISYVERKLEEIRRRDISDVFGSGKPSNKIISILSERLKGITFPTSNFIDHGSYVLRCLKVKRQLFFSEIPDCDSAVNMVFDDNGYLIVPAGNTELRSGFSLIVFAFKETIEDIKKII